MRPIDPERIRDMEHNARRIGEALARAIERMPGGRKAFGFTLLLFSFEGPELTYISSAERASMIKTLQEMLTKLQDTEPGTSADRN